MLQITVVQCTLHGHGLFFVCLFVCLHDAYIVFFRDGSFSSVYLFASYYLLGKEIIFVDSIDLFVCLSFCLLAKLLKKLWTNCDDQSERPAFTDKFMNGL